MCNNSKFSFCSHLLWMFLLFIFHILLFYLKFVGIDGKKGLFGHSLPFDKNQPFPVFSTLKDWTVVHAPENLTAYTIKIGDWSSDFSGMTREFLDCYSILDDSVLGHHIEMTTTRGSRILGCPVQIPWGSVIRFWQMIIRDEDASFPLHPPSTITNFRHILQFLPVKAWKTSNTRLGQFTVGTLLFYFLLMNPLFCSIIGLIRKKMFYGFKFTKNSRQKSEEKKFEDAFFIDWIWLIFGFHFKTISK